MPEEAVEKTSKGKVITFPAPIKKVNSADVPMPYSSFLENMYLPDTEDIILAIEEVCYLNKEYDN